MDAHPSLFSQSIYTALLHNRIHVHTNMYDDDVNELWHQPLLGSSISRLPVSLIRFPPEGKINRVVTYGEHLLSVMRERKLDPLCS